MMKRMLFMLLVLFICSASSILCNAQSVYGNAYFDGDSSGDIAMAIQRNADSSLFVFGSGNRGDIAFRRMIWHLDATGLQLGAKKIYSNPEPVQYFKTLHLDFGTLLRQVGGDYITHQCIEIPSTLAKYGRTDNVSLVRFRPNGDTMWVRTYTDTNLYAQAPYGLSQSSLDSSFVMGGEQYTATGRVSSGFLMFLDSAANLKRQLTFRHPGYGSSISNYIRRPAFLPDGQRVLATCAARTRHTTFNGIDYYKHHPWLFICDTQGRILKDRAMPARYGGSSPTPFSGIDRNGGYYLVGSIDSVVDPMGQPTSPYNYPKFLMHLDTNLNTEWTYSFGDSSHGYYFYTVKQLRNGSYLLIGSSFIRTTTGDAGWLAVVNTNGTLKWSRHYHKSTTWNHQLFDAVENADGSITAVGYGKSDTSARATQTDIWVLNVDSMGCEGPGVCGPSLSVDDAPAARDDDFKLYPNPTSGAFTLESKGGEVVLYDLLGTVVWRQHFGAGKQTVQLPRSLAAGVYLVRFSGTDGAVSQTRLVYKP